MADDLMVETPEVEEVETYEQGEDAPEGDGEPEEQVEQAEGEEEGDETPEEEEKAEEEVAKVEPTAQDGRKMPDAVKKAFAALKSSNPEAAKTLRATWFQNQEYRTAFATPAEAVALKNQFEEIGGAEGIQQIQEEREEWSKVDEAVGEGRAAELLKDNPELFSKNAVGVVNEWAKSMPEQYGYYQNMVAANKIESLGLQTGLVALHNRLKETDPDAAAYIAQMHDKIVDVREQAMQYEQKRKDPREEQLKAKETAFEEKRRADFEGQVATEAESYLATQVDKTIASLLNGRKADDDQMAIFREKVTAEVQKRLAQVPNFANSLEAQYRTGDRAKSVAYVKSQFDRILTAGKAANVIDPLLRNINPQKTAQGKPAAKPVVRASESAGVVNLPDMPNWDKVDWNRTTTQEYAQGRAILTNGKQARW